MSLNWNVSEVKDFSTLCYRQDTAPGADTKLMEDTHHLIFGTLMLDLGSITKANWPEWVFRFNVINRCGMHIATRKDERGIAVPYSPDIHAIHAHIGLRTNTITLSRVKWLKRIITRLEDEMQYKTNQQQLKEK